MSRNVTLCVRRPARLPPARWRGPTPRRPPSDSVTRLSAPTVPVPGWTPPCSARTDPGWTGWRCPSPGGLRRALRGPDPGGGVGRHLGGHLTARARGPASRGAPAARPPGWTPAPTHHGGVGNVTSLAARLSDAAQGGEILISAGVRAEFKNGFETESAGPLELKGISRPQLVYRLLGPQPGRHLGGHLTGLGPGDRHHGGRRRRAHPGGHRRRPPRPTSNAAITVVGPVAVRGPRATPRSRPAPTTPSRLLCC